MECKKSVTKFDKAAGRDITVCEKFDGAADGELGTFAFAPSGLHWGWGLGAGLAASVVAGQLGDKFFATKDGTALLDSERAKYAFGFGAGVPIAVGAVMAIFRGTRTAAWAMMGAGLAGGLVQYFMSKNAIHPLGGMDGDLAGMIIARQQLRGAAPVQILGLPVAKQLKGTPVQIMGTDGAEAPVEVMQGGFGASFGTNFSRT